MAKNKFVPNYAGFDEVRNWASTQATVHAYAENVAKAAEVYGGTYACYDHAGAHRCRTLVVTDDVYAINANRKHNALVKSLGGAYRGE